MSLRDELAKELKRIQAVNPYHIVTKGDGIAYSEQSVANDLIFWLEQKLAEGEAALVGRCIEACQVDARLFSGDRDAYLAGASAAKSKVRAFSPDPHAKERWKLGEAIKQLRWSLPDQMKRPSYDQRRVLLRIEKLDRQLAALPEAKK